LSTEITAAGGQVETVQKMEKKQFSRVANKKYASGYYVNVIFEIQPLAITELKRKFGLSADVFRVLFTESPAVKVAAAAAV
jgi:ribosomal protein S6